MDCTVIDLLEIRDSLGAHWSSRESYTSFCSGCGERVNQTQDHCEFCDMPVVWKHSKVWKHLYGSPSIVEKKIMSTPADGLGRQLCQKAGVQRFSSPHTLIRWKEIREHLSEHDIVGIIDYCATSLTRRGLGMRGLIKFVLNTAERRIMSNEPSTNLTIEIEISDER